MLTIFVLFVGLTLATAVIAYWSDNLGKKLGKKRVSLWGMRPRTTATFLTIASSWLIMIFTLGVMLVIFPPLRQALLRYDEAKAETRDLTVSRDALNGQLVALRKQTDSYKERIDRASSNLTKVQSQLEKSRVEAGKARVDRNKAQRDANAARASARQFLASQRAAVAAEKAAVANLKNVSAQRDATQKQRDEAQRAVGVAGQKLSAVTAKLNGANARVNAAQARVNAATAKVKETETNLLLAQNDLTKVQSDLTDAQKKEKTAQTNAGLAEGRATLADKRAVKAGKLTVESGRQVVEAGKEVAQARNKVAELTAQGDQLQSANDELNRINTRLIQDNTKSRETALILARSDVRVPVDSTFVERSFDKSAPALDVREGLRAMFARADEKIVPGLLPGAQLELAELTSSDGKSLLSTDEIYDNLVNYIANNSNPLSVRLVAARNHLAGESVLEAKFLVVPIRPALPADFELASVELDGREKEGPLFSALLDLVDQGTALAKTKGVRPPLSPDVPNFYAPGSREQIFDTLRAVEAAGGMARVRIVTTQPISTADQLRVRFDVEPLSATKTQTTTQATARMAPPK